MTQSLSNDQAGDQAEDFIRLDAPQDGLPAVVDTADSLAACIASLRCGTGPVAVDAERASGYRYGQHAYLIQLRREGSRTWLIDPIPLGELSALDDALASTEWVLHAATQDIPCLAELGMRPHVLFDTELGARLAGLHRVGLSSSLEYYLGYTLAKEHSAVDWSTRPLPDAWLKYAALDVELLVPLRNRMERDLKEQGKLEWAQQEFAALCSFTGPLSSRTDAWQRTSGVQRLRSPRALAALRELWQERDQIAQTRDVAPGRVLPDATLVDLARRMPRHASGLAPAKPPDRSHTRRRRAEQGLLRYQRTWLAALRRAADMAEDDLPSPPGRGDSPPPARSWADRDPLAASRLQASKVKISQLSEQLDIPPENLMTPELVRRVIWRPPADCSVAGLDAVFEELGARPWQRELVSPLLADVLSAPSE